MPKLSRMRLVSVGHLRARFDDLLLDFRDNEGLATDTVLWLRNGGGKSSLLNLFYSLVRPRQTDFLGGKGGEERRRLADYVQHGDRAMIACEWQLDGENALFDDEPQRYLTLVLLEHRPASASEGPGSSLQRLFLAAESHPEIPELTLEGLPLTTRSAEDGRSMRRSLANFRRAWRDLQADHPHCGVFVTDKQADWTRELESRGIDHELFGYQLEMNSREGGVTSLFTFADADAFVDFLLKTAFDPQDAERVREQVNTFREQLLRRNNQLLPDRDLSRGILERLAPFEAISRSRFELITELGTLAATRASLATKLAALRGEADRSCKASEEAIERFAKLAQQQRSRAEQLRRHALRLRRHAVTARLVVARQEEAQRRAEMEAADREAKLWTAAVPLSHALRYEADARRHRERVRERQEEHAPLIESLTQAANAYYARISADARRAEASAGESSAEAEKLRRRVRDLRAQSARQGEEAVAAASKARGIDEKLESAAQAWRRLVEHGIATPDEQPTRSHATAARLSEWTSTVEANMRDAETARDAAEDRKQALAEEERQVALSIQRRETESQAIGERMDAMRSVRDELASDPTLLKMLQKETVDVDRVCDGAITLARDESHRALERILETRLGRADQEWSAQYLRDEHRMPPSRDTLATLDFLRDRGVACWSGWDYLEKNVATDERRSAIERRPYLASGVIVGDEAALEPLRGGARPASLGGPVAIGTPAQILDESDSAGCVVWGPSGDALFDPKAAGRAGALLSRQIQESREEEEAHREWRESLEHLLRRLEAYRRQYPAGWLEETRAKQLAIENDLAGDKERTEALRSQSSAAKKQLREIASRIGDLQERRIELAEHHQRALSFHEEYGQRIEAWTRERDDLTRRAKSLERARNESDGEIERFELDIRKCDEGFRKLRTDARLLREERNRIKHTDGKVGSGADTDIEAARRAYESLLTEYDSKIGATELQSLAAQRDQDAKGSRAEFERVRDSSISEEAAIAAIESLGVDGSAEQVRDRAKDRHWGAKQAVGNATRRANLLDEKLTDFGAPPEDDSADSAARPIPEDMPPEEADAKAKESEDSTTEAERSAKEAEEQRQLSKDQAHELRAKIEKIGGVAKRVEEIAQSHTELLRLAETGEPSGDGAAPGGEAADVEACDETADWLSRSLKDAKRRWADADHAADGAAKSLHDWCRNDRFASLTESVASRFTELTAEKIENQFSYYREHLQTRIEQIDADLAEANKQRDIVVDAVMSAVTQALGLLNRISRLSRLPESTPGGGRRFIEISTNAPENPADRRGRVADLVDEIMETGLIESGLDLVQRATRRVARPLRVRVLHPDLDATAHRVSIHQMANFSGGERLTGAILLYCALARLRGRQLGITQKRTSVLLLDNPIGTVSRVKYLDLQREVARALGVQLIYATGVHDIDAVASLPNVLRLRNSRRDARTGRRIVEQEGLTDSEAPSLVEAARVHTTPIKAVETEESPANE